jgi:hypothetical protein
MLSPLPVYLDETTAGTPLAPRPETLEGRVIGLLPNWRPSAVKLLEAVGQLLAERYRLQAVVMEQPARELPQRTGGLIDALGSTLDDLAERVDVVITATGDWGSCSTWCSHVTPALEKRGIPTVMIATHTFTNFARRLAATQGCPYIVIAETPNPIRQLDETTLRQRAEAMLDTITFGLTQPPIAIQRSIEKIVTEQIHPHGVVRAALPV